jgi:hypothetical protein
MKKRIQEQIMLFVACGFLVLLIMFEFIENVPPEKAQGMIVIIASMWLCSYIISATSVFMWERLSGRFRDDKTKPSGP